MEWKELNNEGLVSIIDCGITNTKHNMTSCNCEFMKNIKGTCATCGKRFSKESEYTCTDYKFCKDNDHIFIGLDNRHRFLEYEVNESKSSVTLHPDYRPIIICVKCRINKMDNTGIVSCGCELDEIYQRRLPGYTCKLFADHPQKVLDANGNILPHFAPATMWCEPVMDLCTLFKPMNSYQIIESVMLNDSSYTVPTLPIPPPQQESVNLVEHKEGTAKLKVEKSYTALIDAILGLYQTKHPESVAPRDKSINVDKVRPLIGNNQKEGYEMLGKIESIRLDLMHSPHLFHNYIWLNEMVARILEVLLYLGVDSAIIDEIVNTKVFVKESSLQLICQIPELLQQPIQGNSNLSVDYSREDSLIAQIIEMMVRLENGIRLEASIIKKSEVDSLDLNSCMDTMKFGLVQKESAYFSAYSKSKLDLTGGTKSIINLSSGSRNNMSHNVNRKRLSGELFDKIFSCVSYLYVTFFDLKGLPPDITEMVYYVTKENQTNPNCYVRYNIDQVPI